MAVEFWKIEKTSTHPVFKIDLHRLGRRLYVALAARTVS